MMWWRRALLFAVFLEIALIVLVLPVGWLFGTPVMPEAGRTGYTVYYVFVLIACAGVGSAFGRRLVRVIPAQRALHGALLGVFAALVYLGLCSTAPGGISGVIAAYGLPVFVSANALRFAGCVLGAVTAPPAM